MKIEIHPSVPLKALYWWIKVPPVHHLPNRHLHARCYDASQPWTPSYLRKCVFNNLHISRFGHIQLSVDENAVFHGIWMHGSFLLSYGYPLSRGGSLKRRQRGVPGCDNGLYVHNNTYPVNTRLGAPTMWKMKGKCLAVDLTYIVTRWTGVATSSAPITHPTPRNVAIFQILIFQQSSLAELSVRRRQRHNWWD